MVHTKFNYKYNKRYFEKRDKTVPIIVYSIPIVGFILINVNLELGLILFIIGILISVIYYYFTKVPSDPEIDKIFNDEITKARKYGMEKLGIVEEQIQNYPVKDFYGELLDEVIDKEEPINKIGKDGILRCSNYEILYLYGCDEELYLYKYAFSIICDEHEEITDEYFFKDIVSVYTTSKICTINIGDKKVKTLKKSFRLSNAGSQQIECNMRDRDKDKFEDSIKTLKTLIRERKKAV